MNKQNFTQTRSPEMQVDLEHRIKRSLAGDPMTIPLGPQFQASPASPAAAAHKFREPGEEVVIGGMRGLIYGRPLGVDKIPFHTSAADIFRRDSTLGLPFTMVVSVYPDDLNYRALHCGYRDYYIPGAPRGEFRARRIYDSFLMQREVETAEIPNPGERWYPVKIEHTQIAKTAMRQFAGDLRDAPGYGIGVGISNELMVSPEELAFLVERQTRCFALRIQEADRLYTRQKFTEIDDHHYIALDWIQDFDAERHPWRKQVLTGVLMKECMACGKPMKTDKLVCWNCHTNLVTFAMEYGYEPQKDPVLHAAILRLKQSEREVPYQMAEQAVQEGRPIPTTPAPEASRPVMATIDDLGEGVQATTEAEPEAAPEAGEPEPEPVPVMAYRSPRQRGGSGSGART